MVGKRKCDNCGTPQSQRVCGWCYKIKRETGAYPDPKAGRVCRWPTCEDQQVHRDRWLGFCELHFGWNISRSRMRMTWDQFEDLMDEDVPRVVGATGYARVYVGGRWVPEHIHVIQQQLGRPLRKGENVHHINGIRDDNRPENLELWLVAQPAGQRAHEVTCPHCGEHWTAA